MRVTVWLAPPTAMRSPIGPGDCALIVDVLRASTTLTMARANGAVRVIPAATPEEALAARSRMPGALACGERDGRIVAGFDLGNSPYEYLPERVEGRTLVFASTNGSLAMLAASRAAVRVAAAFVNAAAAVERVADGANVAIVCSGKLGEFALEDAACAGLLCERLEGRGAVLEGAAARLARTLAPRDAAEVRALVDGSAQGRHLRGLGPAFARDVELCGRLDTIDRAFEI